VKASDLAWQGNGFYYSRYDAPKPGAELTSSNDEHMVYYHRVGTPQDADELIYADKANPQRFYTLATTEDERFAILYIEDRGEAVCVGEAGESDKPWIKLVPEVTDDEFYVAGNIDDRFLVRTNKDAPNWKLMLIDSKNPAEKNWSVVLPEKPEPLEAVGTAG